MTKRRLNRDPFGRLFLRTLRHGLHFARFQTQPRNHDPCIARITFQIGPGRLRPHEQFGFRGRAQFLRHRLRDIGYRLRAFLNLQKTRGPFARAGRNRIEQASQRIQRVGELFARYSMRALRIGDVFQRFTQKMQRIPDPFERPRRDEPFLDDFATAVPQHQQIGGEVSAVNAGDIFGVERYQMARVVPIVKMAPVQLELTHGLQRGFQTIDGFQCTQPSHVPCRER